MRGGDAVMLLYDVVLVDSGWYVTMMIRGSQGGWREEWHRRCTVRIMNVGINVARCVTGYVM